MTLLTIKIFIRSDIHKQYLYKTDCTRNFRWTCSFYLLIYLTIYYLHVNYLSIDIINQDSWRSEVLKQGQILLSVKTNLYILHTMIQNLYVFKESVCELLQKLTNFHGSRMLIPKVENGFVKLNDICISTTERETIKFLLKACLAQIIYYQIKF